MTPAGASVRRGLALTLLVALVAACDAGPPAPTPAAVAPTLFTLVASGIAYEPTTVAVPAGVPMMVTLEHRDAGIPHGLTLLAGETTLVEETPVIGPTRETYAIGGLIPGRYRFSCVVHPNMLADLIVEGS
ncbi:MAG TPA: cupredoxin domain-containing protein [Candidatus Saccharimonadales bacterium]|nr:cupredoxin domain-containing protein [Candidatus Saccharimonadales bacterium]